MKILHTADWHLGKKLDGISRLEEQKAVMQEICELADTHEVDAVLVAGDLYDTFNPSIEARELFFKTLHKLTNKGKRPVIAIAGNHDAPQLIETPDPLARECGIILSGFPDTQIAEFQLDTGVALSKADKGFIELELPNCDAPLRLLLTPYANELRMKTRLSEDDDEQELRELLESNWANLANKYCDKKGVNMLMTHLFMVKEGAEAVEDADDEKPILHVGGAQAIFSKNIPKQMQYVALGHLHRKQTVDTKPCPMVYSSSPLAYSFAEANQDKYVMLIEASPNKAVAIEPIKLKTGKKLLRERFEGVQAAVKWLEANPNCWVELTIVSDKYLKATDKRLLYESHEGIVSIIPEVTKEFESTDPTSRINLSDNMTDLFKQYFKQKNGQEVSDEVLDIFKEVLATEKES